VKKLREKFSKRRYIASAIIILAAIAITPLLVHQAYIERGRFAVGGEYGVIVLAFIAVAVMLQVLKERDNHEDGGGNDA